MTTNFVSMKKENEATKTLLDQTKNILDQTEFILATTRRYLDEETTLRQAHEEIEMKLTLISEELIATLGETVSDISQLRKKIKRKSNLQLLNKHT